MRYILYYKNLLSEKLLGISAMTLEGIDCETIKFVLLYFRMFFALLKTNNEQVSDF